MLFFWSLIHVAWVGKGWQRRRRENMGKSCLSNCPTVFIKIAINKKVQPKYPIIFFKSIFKIEWLKCGTRSALKWILVQLSELFFLYQLVNYLNISICRALVLVNFWLFFHPLMLLPLFAFTVILLLVIRKRFKKKFRMLIETPYSDS